MTTLRNRSRSFAVVVGAAIVALMASTGGTAGQNPPPAGAQQGAPPPGGRQGGGRQGGPTSFQRSPALPFPTEAKVLSATTQQYRVVPVASGLVNPWSLTFLPGGDILVTEKAGRLRIVRSGTLDPTPISGTPQVVAMGQGGLLEVAPDGLHEVSGRVSKP